MYRAALACLNLLESKIIVLNDPLEVVQKIQRGPKQLLDPEKLMKKAFKRFGSGSVGTLSAKDIIKKRNQNSMSSLE